MTPEEMESAIIRNLPQKTGKTMEEWITITKAQQFDRRKSAVEWLKNVHKLGHVTANIVFSKSIMH